MITPRKLIMKSILIVSGIFLLFIHCSSRKLKSEDEMLTVENINLKSENGIPDEDTVQDDYNKATDTSILGIPYYRIDSLKSVGKKSGGHPLSDSSIAMFLRLSDSTRIMGSYRLDYDGQKFSRISYNKTNRKQLDEEIVEERRGILSIQKRISGKPDYYPLLDQTIEFYDLNDQKIRTFDINKNNPYLKDRTRKVIEFNYPPPSQKSLKLSGHELDWKRHAVKYYAYNKFKVQENGYVNVEYKLYAMDSNEGILKSISTLVILDSTGKESFRLNDLENMLQNYWMTSNAKYLLLNGGGILGEGFQRLEKSFLKIYNVESAVLIYEEELDSPNEDYGDFYESEHPYKISLSFGSYKKSTDHRFTELIFDLEKRMRCIRVMSQNDWNKVIKERIKYSGNVWLHEFKFDCKTF